MIEYYIFGVNDGNSEYIIISQQTPLKILVTKFDCDNTTNTVYTAHTNTTHSTQNTVVHGKHSANTQYARQQVYPGESWYDVRVPRRV